MVLNYAAYLFAYETQRYQDVKFTKVFLLQGHWALQESV